MRVTSITPMKNEGPYIVEWVAHHRAIGINDMLVFTNHCTDGTDLILQRLDEMGMLRHMPNPSIMLEKPRHHIALIRYANEMVRLRRSDWVTNLDADEFVRVKVEGGRLEDLFAALPEADAVTLSLHTFGCGGVEEIAPGGKLVTETFLRRGNSAARRTPVKYLARGGFPWKSFANNTPEIAPQDLARVRWVNGDGKALPQEVIAEPFKALQPRFSGFGLVDVAHYTIRSFEGFLLQRDRGSANPRKGEAPAALDVEEALQYWERFNQNEVRDEIAVAGLPGLRDAVEDLLRDPELRALHDASVAWHRARAKALLEQPTFRKLNEAIRRQHARTMVE